ncbi:hypothetical protein PtB15_6B814 [Puccinia triticina]|nr:hypothetical protein PtB15_6B814 [Puccinia triticina]
MDPYKAVHYVAPTKNINHAESSSGSYQVGRVPQEWKERHDILGQQQEKIDELLKPAVTSYGLVPPIHMQTADEQYLDEAVKFSAVKAVLTTILEHEREIFPNTVHRSTQYDLICKGFLQNNFRSKKYLTTLVKILENPEALENSAGRRIQYQLVFYIFDFIIDSNNNNLKFITEVGGQIYDVEGRREKLLFLTRHLKKYRNRFLDDRYKYTEQDFSPFISLANTSEPFYDWIHKVLGETFEHKTVISDLPNTIVKAQYDLWMRELSNDKLVQLLLIVPSQRFKHWARSTKRNIDLRLPRPEIIRLLMD